MNNFSENQVVDSLSSLCETGACRKKRKYEKILKDTITDTPVKSTVYKRAEIVSDTIINALKYKEKNKKNIMEYMNGRYVEAGFINPQQKKQTLLDDWHRVMRYLNDEERLPSFPDGKLICLDENIRPIMVKPHVMFECGDQVEIVMFKIGRPNITQSGNKNAIKRDMQLYSMILYGRKLGFKNVTASFYFLKKDNDRTTWSRNEPYFFGGGGSIVNMQSLQAEDEETDLDVKMAGLIEQYVDGISEEELSEDDCKYCKYVNICKYKSAPISVLEENEDGE